MLYCTPNKPRSPSFFWSFLYASCLSQCEGVCGCGGLASSRWMPVGVFMVYFWPQQQKACWCSKSVAPIVSIRVHLNSFALCPWHSGNRWPGLARLPSTSWSYRGKCTERQPRASTQISHSQHIWTNPVFVFCICHNPSKIIQLYCQTSNDFISLSIVDKLLFVLNLVNAFSTDDIKLFSEI